MILNYLKINKFVKTHRQIEVKDGNIYMRAKKRNLILVSHI